MTATGSSSTNAYQFTGRETDGTGLMYYRARYYSPTFHRFISEDPIGFAGGDPNLYAYVFNSPLRYRDPYGLWSVTVDGYVPSFGPFGPGGGVAFGQNPGGSPFFEAFVGFGAGGGASVDPDGTSSGLGGRKPPEGLNVGFGVYGNVGAGVGPLNGQVSGDLGVNIPSQGPPEKYSNPPELSGNPGDFSSKWDVRFSGGAGGRVTFY